MTQGEDNVLPLSVWGTLYKLCSDPRRRQCVEDIVAPGDNAISGQSVSPSLAVADRVDVCVLSLTRYKDNSRHDDAFSAPSH